MCMFSRHDGIIFSVNCFIKPIITAVLAERLVKQHVSILTADPGKPFNWVNEHAVILYTVLFTDVDFVFCCHECNNRLQTEQEQHASVEMQKYRVEISVEKLMGNFDRHAKEWKLTGCISKWEVAQQNK